MDFPDPSYPYQTEGALAYLSTGWFCVGVVLSGIFISMFITSDVLILVQRQLKRRDWINMQGWAKFQA